MINYEQMKPDILKKSPHISEPELDELLRNNSLMLFIDNLCREKESDVPSYVSFIANSIDAAFDPNYPANGEYALQAMSVKMKYRERPTLVNFMNEVKAYSDQKEIERKTEELMSASKR